MGHLGRERETSPHSKVRVGSGELLEVNMVATEP